MFPLNGESTGYALKPRGTVKAAAHIKDMFKWSRWVVSITVVSAWLLHRPSKLDRGKEFSPSVSIQLVGARGGSVEAKKASFFRRRSVPKIDVGENAPVFTTKEVKDDGFNPVWNSEWSCEISEEDLPYAFIRFGVVADDVEKEIARNTFRVQYLNQGEYT